MGDIEMLVRLSADLSRFEREELETELKYVDEINRAKIRAIIKRFIYMFLNYILRLISVVSTDLQGKPNNQLKQLLMEYANIIAYRISQFVQEQVVYLNKVSADLKKTLDESQKIRNTVNEKIDKLVALLTKQNEQLDNLEKTLTAIEEKKKDNIQERLTSIEGNIEQIGGMVSEMNKESSQRVVY